MDCIALWMERRGWIYWRKTKREGGGATAGFLTGFQQIVEPQIEHRMQVMEERNESIGQSRTGVRDDARWIASATRNPSKRLARHRALHDQ